MQCYDLGVSHGFWRYINMASWKTDLIIEDASPIEHRDFQPAVLDYRSICRYGPVCRYLPRMRDKRIDMPLTDFA